MLSSKICGSPYMAPLYNPQTEKMEDAKLCIDQFEFPNIPCDYPVVWVRANEAAAICEAAGKRLCDAHEWEGACDGAILEPDYLFDVASKESDSNKVKKRRQVHNRNVKRRWAYGAKEKKVSVLRLVKSQKVVMGGIIKVRFQYLSFWL